MSGINRNACPLSIGISVCFQPECALAEKVACLGVVDLTIESRQHRNDQRDNSTLIKARQKLSMDLAYSHATPSEEPLLWMADAVAGAVLAHVRKDRRYVDALAPGVLTITTGP